MRFPPVRVSLIVVLAAVAAVTACSSGGTKPGASASASPASPTSAASTSAAPSAAPSGGSTSAAAAQIKTNWVAFFNPKTSVTERVNLLQNGPTFESIIKAQASSPLASSATSSVTAVTVESSTQAKVTYSILVSGTPALKNQPGVSVYQNGTWKVGDQSFCALLTLENSGKAPSVCASAAS